MAAKKTAAKPTKSVEPAAPSGDVETFLTALPEPRRSELRRLHALIVATVPQFAPHVVGSMIGYGPYQYRYESGREGRSSRVALASRAQAISIYVAAADERGWLAERAAPALGKVKVGKSCIGVKKLDDLSTEAFVDLLRRAAAIRGPGEVDG